MSEKTPACIACGNTQLTKYLDAKDYFLSQESFTLLRCTNCETITTWPQPAPDKIRAYYDSPDYISHDADKTDLLSNIYKLVRKISLIRKFRIINKNSAALTLLDVGCGTGEFLAYCKKKGMDVTGVEPGTKAREYAENKHNLRVLEKMELLETENKLFTRITLWHVLEHFHDPARELQTLVKYLAPGGRMIVALPNYSSHDAQHYQQFWAAYDTPRHLVHFNRTAFLKFSGKLGLTVEEIHPQKLDAFYISLLSEKYQGSSLRILKAIFRGILSNYKARDPNLGHSSLIYILTRKIS